MCAGSDLGVLQRVQPCHIFWESAHGGVQCHLPSVAAEPQTPNTLPPPPIPVGEHVNVLFHREKDHNGRVTWSAKHLAFLIRFARITDLSKHLSCAYVTCESSHSTVTMAVPRSFSGLVQMAQGASSGGGGGGCGGPLPRMVVVEFLCSAPKSVISRFH